ncbi:hypothetical protein BDQ17DRAFT_1366841, partial [Cyathus striatus]
IRTEAGVEPQTQSRAAPKLDVLQLPQETLDFEHWIFDTAQNGDSAMLLTAVDAGHPVNLMNDKGARCLPNHSTQYAISSFTGADPNRLNNLGQSVVAGAVFKGLSEIVHALAEKGADPRLRALNAIQAAVMFKREDLFEVLGRKRIRITRLLSHQFCAE